MLWYRTSRVRLEPLQSFPQPEQERGAYNGKSLVKIMRLLSRVGHRRSSVLADLRDAD